jgi:hypothetical protein
MLNPLLDKPEFITDLHRRFANAKPFRYVVIDNFLDPATARCLSENFPSLEEMKVSYNGINEKKAEHSSFANLASCFEETRHKLFENDFVRRIESISGLEGLSVLDDRYGYGLHQGGNGSFLDIHIDYNIHPLKKKHRRLNMILFLSKQWEEKWGGHMQFWNADVTQCMQAIKPEFNRCVIFECNNISYHGYETIICPEEVTRKSFYLYFFTEVAENLRFHDTVFKPLPTDSLAKKIKVSLKEVIKNSVKRILYNTGLTKLLK